MVRKGWYGRPDIGKRVAQKRRSGMIWDDIADDLGISTSTLYNWRTGRSRMRESTADRVRDEILYEKVHADTITWSEYKEERDVHGDDLEPLDAAQGDLFYAAFGRVPESDEEVRRMTVEAVIDGKTVKWLYGRSHDASVKQAAIDSLKAQGLSVADAQKTYNEATGYSRA